ncbi:hypothetical protein BDW71DRAFT_205251 [Aspergillus fruticulosus]
MPDLHSLPEGWWPEHTICNNGPDALVLERMKLGELAEGWPCYRDACEWENFASIFHPGAYTYTTWSGKVQFTEFFAVSKNGMDRGAFIMPQAMLQISTRMFPILFHVDSSAFDFIL